MRPAEANDRALPVHMIEAAEKILESTRDGEDTFMANPMVQDAVTRKALCAGPRHEVAQRVHASRGPAAHREAYDARRGCSTVDAARVRRYRDKLRRADDALADVEAWIGEADEDRKSRRAVYKAFQEACEAVTGLAAMVVVDSGVTSKDDYLNLDEAAKVGLRIAPLLDELKEATGLRNRLVHEYNGLDDATALEAIRALMPAVWSFLEEVEAWSTSKS